MWRAAATAMSAAILILWGSTWLPPQLLPQPLHSVLYWVGGLLTMLVFPATILLVWLAWPRRKRGRISSGSGYQLRP